MPQIRHRILGLRCWIGDTAHPIARQHRNQFCIIQAVWRFGTALMVSITLSNGQTIHGLFLYELIDEQGHSLRYKDC